ncbi:MAG: hypothetical protein Q7S53_03490 [bacterium]|nr:hypothetical protein [bacterium]
MKREPYIGITGFMTREEVDEVMSAIPEGSTKKFMVGILASQKTIAGLPNKWPERYPITRDIAKITSDDERALNLVHYGDGMKHHEGLGKVLISITREYGGPNLHGFQLNMTWPEAREITEFKEKYPEMQIVLQAGTRTLKNTDESAEKLVNGFQTAFPNGEVDYLILDLSGGLGKELNPDLIMRHIEAIETANLDVGVVLAGGLYGKNSNIVAPILRRFPNTGTDAEGKLRDPITDKLNIKEAIDYTSTYYRL